MKCIHLYIKAQMKDGITSQKKEQKKAIKHARKNKRKQASQKKQL